MRKSLNMVSTPIYNYYLYREMIRNTKRGLEKLENEQLKKINKILKNIYLKREYYSYFNGIYDNVKKIERLSEISKLPIMTKSKLRIFAHNFKRNNYYKELASLTTSGSTGRVNQIFLSIQENSIRAASFFRMLRYNGYRWNDIIFSLVEPQYMQFKKRKWYHYFGLLREATVGCEIDIGRQIDYFSAIQPTVLRGRTSAIYRLAAEIKERRLSTNIRLIFTTGEKLFEEDRNFIERAFNCPVFDYYSTTECGVIAWECFKHNGYHIDMDNIFIELIFDSAKDKYKVVATNLFALNFPILRYDLDDFFSVAVGQCSCGCNFPIIKGIEGHKIFYNNVTEE